MTTEQRFQQAKDIRRNNERLRKPQRQRKSSRFEQLIRLCGHHQMMCPCDLCNEQRNLFRDGPAR